MKKTTKIILIIAAVVVALVVLFNFLPGGVRISSTISFAAGIVGGIVAKVWYDRKSQEKEGEA